MNWRNAGILVLVLVVPVLLILVFRTGTTRLTHLPIYGSTEYVGSDSVNYQVDFSALTDKDLPQKHLLLYFSDGVRNLISPKAEEHLNKVSERLKEVNDIAFVYFGENQVPSESTDEIFRVKTNVDLGAFVKNQLILDFQKSPEPIKDHLVVLVDKDRRVRGYYFAAHDRFDRKVLGELVVLRDEYTIATQ